MKLFKILSITIVMAMGLHAEVFFSESTLIHDENPANGGASVSVSGEWAAVGAYDPNDSQSCYISMFKFNYDPNVWEWEFFETIPTKGTINCKGNKGLGVAVSLSGTKLAAGLENYDDGSDKNIGAFSTYEFDGTTWAEKNVHVVNPDAQALSGFGETLSIRGDYLIVGSPKYTTLTNQREAGKVYVYNWGSTIPTVAIDGPKAGENFGQAVTGQDLELLVGAPGYDVGTNTNEGAAYLFEFDGTVMTLLEILAGTSPGDGIGTQVSMDSENILVSGDTVHAFVKDSGSWSSGISLGWVFKGDVSISDGVFSVGYLGRSVHNYLDLHKDLSILHYNVDVRPTITDSLETAEDISLHKDQLLVKHSITEPAYAYDFPCGYGTQLVENTWSMIGVPCAVTAGTTVGDAFNANPTFGNHDDLGTYGDEWVVYEQNSTYGATNESYLLMAENDVVEQGKGYWIICDHNVTTRVDKTVSSARTTLYVNSLADDVIGAIAIQGLPDGNSTGEGFTKVLLTNDLSRRIHWGNVWLGEGALTMRMGSPGSLNVFENATAYVYDETGTSQPYRAITTTPGFGDIIEPGQGYWVKILAPSTGVSIVLPYEK